MSVTNVELTSIEARRYSRPTERHGQVRIDHNSTVTLVQEKDGNTADVEFRYTASYSSIGVIRLEGVVTYQGEVQDLAAEWQKTNQMPPAIASEIHTAVMRVCVPEAVGIAKNLKLPPPIPLPQVRFGNKEGGSPSATSHGPEVA